MDVIDLRLDWRHRVLACVILVLISSVPAYADIILALDINGSDTVNTGVAGPGKLIHFYISQDGTDSIAGASPAFELEAGIVTGGTISAAGAVGTPGYFGAGQWFDSSFDIIDDDYFELYQEADDLMVGVTPPSFPTFERYFTLELDTTGLATGEYLIELLPGPTNFLDTVLAGIDSNTEFYFQVGPTAVPEPSSVLLMLAGGIACLVRRFRPTVDSSFGLG